MNRRYTINVREAEVYTPVMHKNTKNYRLSGWGGLKTNNFEILLGELKKGSEAEYHLHRKSEQAIFILEGGCDLEFEDGTKEGAYKEDLVVIPPGLGHRLVVTSDNFRALIVYSPILGKDDMIPV
jgi:quercetin dioxygenase-like cupin family protein